jgi:hypothetical protein
MLVVLDRFDDTCSGPLSVIGGCRQEGPSDQVFGLDDHKTVVFSSLAILGNFRRNVLLFYLPTEDIRLEVGCTISDASRMHVGPLDCRQGVIRQYEIRHCMADDMLGNANESSMCFSTVGWKIRVVDLVVDFLPPMAGSIEAG